MTSTSSTIQLTGYGADRATAHRHYSNSTLKTVDSAVAGGITWVNAAGNEATETWFGNFNDPDGSMAYHVFP